MGIRERSESRDGYAVRVLAVHTSEGFDKPVVDDAAALRDATWWVGSSHAIADNDPGSLLTPAEGCVPYERASWTLRSGNRWSENIELIAQAGWTRAQWLARPTLLDRCAYWLADRSKVDRGGGRRIPLVKITPAQYRAGAWGVIGHHDHTVGYSDGTHWDPGPGFPWDVVLAKATAYRNGTSGGFPTMGRLDNEAATHVSEIVVNALTTAGIGALDWKGTRNGPTSIVQQMRLDAEGLAALYAAETATQKLLSEVLVRLGNSDAVAGLSAADVASLIESSREAGHEGAKEFFDNLRVTIVSDDNAATTA